MFSNYLYSSGICCELNNEPLLHFINEISVGDIIRVSITFNSLFQTEEAYEIYS